MRRRQFLQWGSAALAAGWCPGLATAADVAAGPAAGSGTGLVLDPRFLQHVLAPGHPESPQRLAAVQVRLQQAGLVQACAPVPLLDGAEAHLYSIHTPAHVDAIRRDYGDTHDHALLAVAAGLGAVTEVCEGRLRNAFCAVRPPGHHARNTGREEGFCFYNSVAVAARFAQRAFGLSRILIVDWDYHHGDGTELAFYDDPGVLFFSTHDYLSYPGTGHPGRRGEGAGEGYNINVHLPCGATDRDMLQAFESRLLPAAEAFRPELVLISAGFDSRIDDLLGCHAISDAGFAELTRRVMDIAGRHCDGRIVSMLEGGYNLDGLAGAAEAHLSALLGAM